MVMYSVTDDYDGLVEMFIRHGLEFSFDEPLPTDLVQCWEAREAEDAAGAAAGRRIGGCVLALRGGKYIIDGISAEPEYRKQKVGGTMLEMALQEARDRDADEVWLVAKAPGFFRKHGFVTVSPEAAPEGVFDCLQCPQFQVDCWPEIMVLKLR